MKRTPWFDRKFPPIDDSGLLPTIIERLDGTAARLEKRFSQKSTDPQATDPGKWGLKKEIGHLIDLEPLWLGRARQIIAGQADMAAADLTNRRTHETDHGSTEMKALLETFAAERAKFVAALRGATDADLEKAARHPRLGTPMRLVDLAFFVAEHDDHHLAQMTFLENLERNRG